MQEFPQKANFKKCNSCERERQYKMDCPNIRKVRVPIRVV